MRRLADAPNVSALMVAKTSLFRVPQIAERMLPFCVLIGAMSCYLGLSRRLELVVSRAAGMSAWQFIAPAVFVALRRRRVRHHRLQSDRRRSCMSNPSAWKPRFPATSRPACRPPSTASGCASAAPTASRSSMPRAAASRASADQRHRLHVRPGRQVHRADRGSSGARFEPGYWQLDGRPRATRRACRRSNASSYRLTTNLTPEQVRETFSTPETVPFWQLPELHRAGRTRGPARRRLPPAISEAAGAAVHARGDGAAGRRLQPAVLPLRRRAEDGAGRRGLGLFALRACRR